MGGRWGGGGRHEAIIKKIVQTLIFFCWLAACMQPYVELPWQHDTLPATAFWLRTPNCIPFCPLKSNKTFGNTVHI